MQDVLIHAGFTYVAVEIRVRMHMSDYNYIGSETFVKKNQWNSNQNIKICNLWKCVWNYHGLHGGNCCLGFNVLRTFFNTNMVELPLLRGSICNYAK